MSVDRIYHREVVTIEPDASIKEAAALMRTKNVGTLVVVAPGQRRPLGMLTDRDIVTRGVALGIPQDLTVARYLMTPNVKRVTPTTSIEGALTIMQANSLRRLPVVDDAGSLIGIVSMDDILDLVAREFSAVRAVLSAESPTIKSAEPCMEE